MEFKFFKIGKNHCAQLSPSQQNIQSTANALYLAFVKENEKKMEEGNLNP